VSARQLLNDILEKLDHIYDQVTQSEREETSKQALHEIVLEGEKPGSYGYHMKTGKLIDRLVPFLQNDKPLDKETLGDLFLSVLDATRGELEGKASILQVKNRVKEILNNISTNCGLSEDLRKEVLEGHAPIVRELDGWSIRCAYTPHFGDAYSYLLNVYGAGDYGALRGVSKDLVVTIGHRWRSPNPTYNDIKDYLKLDFPGFLKIPRIEKLCQRFGIRFRIVSPFGGGNWSQEAKGGYEAMLETLNGVLKNTPYSAEKLIGNLREINIFHDDSDFGFELFATETRTSDKDVAAGLILGFGVNFHQITLEQWNEVKNLVLGAFESLQTLREQETDLNKTHN
jgi:hypothetical protein